MYVLDTQKIGRKIMTARKEKNMTQLALADQLGVSYQAISNWERGQSAPDIDKLPDLAQVLGISLNDLFDMDDADKKVVSIRQEDAPVDATTLTEFAPMIKPDTLSKKVSVDAADFSIDDVKTIAPFVSEETLVTLMNEHADANNFNELVVVAAPFLSKEYLAQQVDVLLAGNKEVDMRTARRLLPFLDQEKVDALLARRVARGDVDDTELVYYFPFASKKALGAIVNEHEHDIKFIRKAAPFLEHERIDQMFKQAATKKDISLSDLNSLAPFVSSGVLKDVVLELINNSEHEIKLHDLMGLLPFLGDNDILSLIHK
ncbi:helix-turn-helix domain-containing protein [Lacticaseibacillus hulanensis]|uniref:helix-turn-helix domain-containing protein n=1 Tax=Lacticaseibacillus hulanensis TaxID=2493111 RepID=UPI000FDC703B|nr:helix-turn-helix transcriptional regulator [Lacticaseibacillus hulanensis]